LWLFFDIWDIGNLFNNPLFDLFSKLLINDLNPKLTIYAGEL